MLKKTCHMKMVILSTHIIILNLIIGEKEIILRPKYLLIWTYGDLADGAH